MTPIFPKINASLNGLAGVLLLFGFRAIKKNRQDIHKKFMIAALICSTLFLICYLTYHLSGAGVTRYKGTGLLRFIYFFILGTHTPLAIIIVPFCLRAVYHAVKGNFTKHTRITRWLFPVWMYVSLTGVIIYWMLYILPQQ